MPRPLFQCDGVSPHTMTFGSQGDISNIYTFGWYEWVYFRDHGSFPSNKEQLGRVLGPLRNEGNEMAQAVLNGNGKVVPRRTLRRITTAELHSDTEKQKRKLFDHLILAKLGPSISFPPKPLPPNHVPYSDDCEPDLISLPDDNDPVASDVTAVFEKPITDRWVHAELHLPQGEEMKSAKVMGRSKDADGNIIGTYNDDPMLNSISYAVEFPDGEIREYSANVIAENMYVQVDAEGFHHSLLDAILDYKRNDKAVDKADMYITTKSGQRRLRKTTAGWKLLVQWRHGNQEWLPLNILKELNPVEVAEFAISRNIDSEPAFIWWVPYTLRRRDRIIAAANARVRRVSHKYGIQIPNSVLEAYKIDERNGNTFWRDAINKEMENLKVAFDILPDKEGASAWLHQGQWTYQIRCQNDSGA